MEHMRTDATYVDSTDGIQRFRTTLPPDESFNDWGGGGYDNFVPEEVSKTAPPEDRTA